MMRVRVLYDPFFRRRLLTMSSAFRLPRYPVRSAQAAEGLDRKRRQTSGRWAEESGHAGEEGDWWTCGWRSQEEMTGGKTGNRLSQVAIINLHYRV